jgi:RNA polymerase-interacting CarD/CdnL/TRCF family regulator
MEFKIGDSVVHPIYGVGRIVRMDKKLFTGAEARLYYEVSTLKTTVWVPAETYEAIGLRRLTAKIDLNACRDVLKRRPLQLDKDHAKRRLELIERMKRGSFKALCELVRDLTARGWIKPLGGADAQSLRKAHEHLCQEWAAAEGVSSAQAAEEVDALLLEARKMYS